ncbi:sugar ABC transporter permease [Candidatus Aerophobetes bacterium]|nr:sugar ABC transporter permease [Candidatus Aerophobetes bacterium]
MKRRKIGYILLLPSLLFLLVIIIYPLVYSLYLSFTDFTFGKPFTFFVGLGNYQDIFHDEYFFNSLTVTAKFTFLTVSTEFILGLGVALLLTRRFKGRTFIRTTMLAPMMITPVVVGIIWRLLFQPDFTILNYILSIFKIPGPLWLQEHNWALISVAIADIWQWTPFFILILTSGLVSLPQEPIEAAWVDGASRSQTFWYISLPLLKPLISVALLLRIIDSFRTYDLVYVMTYGGPGTATELLSYRIWKEGFVFQRLGYAAAMSYIMVFVLTILSLILIRSIRRRI